MGVGPFVDVSKVSTVHLGKMSKFTLRVFAERLREQKRFGVIFILKEYCGDPFCRIFFKKNKRIWDEA